MPRTEHLVQLEKGKDSWNQWRRENPNIIPNLRKAELKSKDLAFFDFRGADLSEAKLECCRLTSTLFNGADARKAKFIAADLRFSEFRDAILTEANFSKANLTDAQLQKAKLNGTDLRQTILCGATLKYADLHNANLTKADLRGGSLQYINLECANLTAVQALDANLEKAILTGACIEDWNINSGTVLEGISCQYIFQRKALDLSFTSRCPEGRDFGGGEFTTRFKQISEVAEIFFQDGINWQAFMNTYNRLSNDYEEDLVGIQALERKSKNDFIVRFEVSSDADRAALIEDTKRFYEEDLALTESVYRTQYQFTEQELNRERQHNTDIMKIISQLASTPVTINVESKSILQSDTFNNNFEDSTVGNFSNRIHDNGTQTTN